MGEGTSAGGLIRDLSTLRVTDEGRVVPGDMELPYRIAYEPAPDAVVMAHAYLMMMATYDARPKTIKAYASDILLWLRFLSAIDVPFDRARVRDWDDYVRFKKTTLKTAGNRRRPDPSRSQINAITGKKAPHPTRYANTTLNRYRSSLFQWYEFLLDAHGKPLINPIRNASNPDRRAQRRNALSGRPYSPAATPRKLRSGRLPVEKRLPRYLDHDQFLDLTGAITNQRDRAMLRLFVDSGPRAEELLGMNGQDVNWGRALVTYRRKGGIRTDLIPVGTDAIGEIRRYHLEIGYEPGPEDPVWVNLRGARMRLDYDALRSVFRRANKALGTDWTAHDLRHTCAVWLLEGGMDIRKVQEMLGHEQLTTTQVYTKVRVDELVEAHAEALQRRGQRRETSQRFHVAYSASDLADIFGDE